MKNAKHFYKYAKKHGVNLAGLDFGNIDFEVPKATESTLKLRPTYIKEKYNHVFSFPVEHHLKGIEALERFINNNLNLT